MTDFICYFCKITPLHLVDAHSYKKMAAHLEEGAGWKYACRKCYKKIMENELEKIKSLAIDFYAKLKVHENDSKVSCYVEHLKYYLNDNHRN